MALGASEAPPLVTAANTEIARLAGCSQLGQSAPEELMAWSFSNLWLQVGQRYSYSGISTPSKGPAQHRSDPLNRPNWQDLD